MVESRYTEPQDGSGAGKALSFKAEKEGRSLSEANEAPSGSSSRNRPSRSLSRNRPSRSAPLSEEGASGVSESQLSSKKRKRPLSEEGTPGVLESEPPLKKRKHDRLLTQPQEEDQEHDRWLAELNEEVEEYQRLLAQQRDRSGAKIREKDQQRAQLEVQGHQKNQQSARFFAQAREKDQQRLRLKAQAQEMAQERDRFFDLAVKEEEVQKHDRLLAQANEKELQRARLEAQAEETTQERDRFFDLAQETARERDRFFTQAQETAQERDQLKAQVQKEDAQERDRFAERFGDRLRDRFRDQLGVNEGTFPDPKGSRKDVSPRSPRNSPSRFACTSQPSEMASSLKKSEKERLTETLTEERREPFFQKKGREWLQLIECNPSQIELSSHPVGLDLWPSLSFALALVLLFVGVRKLVEERKLTDSLFVLLKTKNRRFWCWCLTVLYLFFMFIFPLLSLLKSGSESMWSSFCYLATQPVALSAYKVTGEMALLAALFNGSFGMILAWVLARYNFPGKRILDAAVDLPFALPTSVAGLTIATVYSHQGWMGPLVARAGIEVVFTRLGIVVAMVFVSFPFVVRTLQPVIQDMEAELEEAAWCLGASPWKTFQRVVFPSLLPPLLTGMLLAFSRSIGEYGSVIIVSSNIPFNDLVAPVLIFQNLEQYEHKAAGVVGTVVLLASLVLLFGANLLQSWNRGLTR